MAECPLREVMVDVDIAPQGRRQVLTRAAATGRQDRAEAAIAARDHAVGLGMARRDEAVLKVLCGTDPIAARLAGRFPLASGAEPVGQLLAVIGQEVGDPEGGRLEKVGQEALGAGGGPFGQDLDSDPPGGAVDGGEPVAAQVRVGQLRPVLNIDRDQAGDIVLEG